MVKAKFYVANVEHATGTDPENMQGTVKLQAVCRGASNAQWSKATPSGSMQLYINNPPAFLWFHERIGKEVAITIDEASNDPTTHAYVEPDPVVEESTWMKNTCGECGQAKELHTS